MRSQSGQLQAELQALAAAAPQLSLSNCQQLEAQVHTLGRQLLALEGFMQLNETGFVKIVKKHDKVKGGVCAGTQAGRQSALTGQKLVCVSWQQSHFKHPSSCLLLASLT